MIVTNQSLNLLKFTNKSFTDSQHSCSSWCIDVNYAQHGIDIIESLLGHYISEKKLIGDLFYACKLVQMYLFLSNFFLYIK